jgi:hypothetical protein
MIQFCAPTVVGSDPANNLPIWACQGGKESLAASHSFNEVLPSLNAKFRLDDDMFLRLGISQSIS